MKKITITDDNKIYALTELDFTHDHSTVKVGSIMIDRDGRKYKITKIDKDDCGKRQFWNGKKLLAHQYDSPYNMLTKQPFFAHEFKISSK